MGIRSLQRNAEQVAGKNVNSRQNVCETVRRQKWTNDIYFQHVFLSVARVVDFL